MPDVEVITLEQHHRVAPRPRRIRQAPEQLAERPPAARPVPDRDAVAVRRTVGVYRCNRLTPSSAVAIIGARGPGR